MPKVYFDAFSSRTVAGRAAGIIVDLLHFSSRNKMEQMVAFLASRCPATTYQCFQSQIHSLRGVKNPNFTLVVGTNSKQRSPTSYLLLPQWSHYFLHG